MYIEMQMYINKKKSIKQHDTMYVNKTYPASKQYKSIIKMVLGKMMFLIYKKTTHSTKQQNTSVYLYVYIKTLSYCTLFDINLFKI